MTDTVATLKQQLLDLKAGHASGAVSDGQFEARRAALEKSLLEAVMQEGGEAPAAEGRVKAGQRAKSGKPAAAAPASAGPKPAGSSTEAAVARPSRKLVLLLVTGVVVLASAGYAWKGSPEWIGPGARERVAAAAAANSEGHAIGKEEFLGMIQKLADRLKEQPDNVEGWVMLGRSYTVVGQYPDALKAYERAVALRPDDAQVLADYADSMAVNNNMTLSGEPMKWVRKALQVDPNNLKALALAGTDAFIRKDYAGAVKYWQHLVDIGPPDSEYVREMAAGLKEARELGGLPATTAKASSGAAPSGSAGATPAAGAKTVSGVVSLAPALAKLAAPDDTVFILARPSAGRGMPVAILRKNVRDLPIRFSLDDSSSMSPAATLSGAGTVVIEARISKSGNAMRQSGDLAGQSEPVPVGASGLKIEIRDVVKP